MIQFWRTGYGLFSQAPKPGVVEIAGIVRDLDGSIVIASPVRVPPRDGPVRPGSTGTILRRSTRIERREDDFSLVACDSADTVLDGSCKSSHQAREHIAMDRLTRLAHARSSYIALLIAGVAFFFIGNLGGKEGNPSWLLAPVCILW